MDFESRPEAEKKDSRPIFDAGQYGINGILIAFVFFEKEGFQVIKEFLYKSNTIY